MSLVRKFVVSCGHRTLPKFRLNNETISVECHEDGTFEWGDIKYNSPAQIAPEQCVARMFRENGSFNIYVREQKQPKHNEDEYVALGGMLF